MYFTALITATVWPSTLPQTVRSVLVVWVRLEMFALLVVWMWLFFILGTNLSSANPTVHPPPSLAPCPSPSALQHICTHSQTHTVHMEQLAPKSSRTHSQGRRWGSPQAAQRVPVGWKLGQTAEMSFMCVLVSHQPGALWASQWAAGMWILSLYTNCGKAEVRTCISVCLQQKLFSLQHYS